MNKLIIILLTKLIGRIDERDDERDDVYRKHTELEIVNLHDYIKRFMDIDE